MFSATFRRNLKPFYFNYNIFQRNQQPIDTRIFYVLYKTQAKNKKSKKMARYWIPDAMSLPKKDQKQYRLLSYNILAQDLLVEHMYLYLNIDPNYLKWEHRLCMIVEEIKAIKPDIICLQEMQFNHLKQLLRKIQTDTELEFIFKKKTGHRTDGCAIIYDRKKFRLSEYRGLEYYTPGVDKLDRENVAIMGRFKLLEENGKEVVISTTHLLYNPRRCDVRVAQINKLQLVLQDFSKTNNGKVPVILTGDFNCLRDSMPYALLTATSDQLINIRQSMEKDDILVFRALNFGDDSASTFQEQWITVDYIAYSIDVNRPAVNVWRLYGLPNIANCEKSGYIPNKYLGSDHYSLSIIFSIS